MKRSEERLQFKQSLQYDLMLANMETEAVALKKKMDKVKILKQHKYEIFESNNKWCTYVPCDNRYGRKVIRRTSYDALIDALTDFYAQAKNNCTIAETFPHWLSYKAIQTCTADKTIDVYHSDYRTFFEGSELVGIPFDRLDERDIEAFFVKLTAKREYTSKRVMNLKSMLNGILEYARLERLIDENPMRNLTIKGMTFKPIQERIENVYSVEETQKLLLSMQNMTERDYVRLGYKADDVYAYAIRLMFNLFCRVGELKALKWSDIDFEKRTVFLHAQVLESVGHTEYSDHIKGNSDKGARYQYLTDEAIEILTHIREEGNGGEFVFQVNGHFLHTNIFNRHLKRYCENAGIPYYSSHKIRFYNASVTYDGKNLAQLQSLMGHSQSATTLHYLRNADRTKDMAEHFSKLGVQKCSKVFKD